jgi:8-oxo-dGTP pyrophosphatase MutT (NUDIX family)
MRLPSLHEERSYLRRLADQASKIFEGRLVPQSGAICVRKTDHGKEFLLITSRDTGRWVIPKGCVEKDESAHHAAAREAREEAGIRGKTAKKPFGYYTYVKGKENVACLVSVFIIEVKNVNGDFLEAETRTLSWVSALEAARRVEEPELKGLFVKLASA